VACGSQRAIDSPPLMDVAVACGSQRAVDSPPCISVSYVPFGFGGHGGREGVAVDWIKLHWEEHHNL